MKDNSLSPLVRRVYPVVLDARFHAEVEKILTQVAGIEDPKAWMAQCRETHGIRVADKCRWDRHRYFLDCAHAYLKELFSCGIHLTPNVIGQAREYCSYLEKEHSESRTRGEVGSTAWIESRETLRRFLIGF